MTEETNFDRFGLIKIAGADPERFMIALLDSSLPQHQPFLSTSRDLSESELRSELEKRGLNTFGIEELIEKARAEPK